MRDWEAEGSTRAILFGGRDGVVQKGDLEEGNIRLLSYLEVHSDEGVLEDVSVINADNTSCVLDVKSIMKTPPISLLNVEEMARWIRRKPE